MSAKPTIFHRGHPSHALMRGVSVLFTTLIVTGVALAALSAPTSGDSIVRGVEIADIAVGGLTREAAMAAVHTKTDALRLTFAVRGDRVIIDPQSVVEGKSIATFDVRGAVASAHAVGRKGGAISATIARMRSLLVGNEVDLPTTLDRKALRETITAQLGPAISPAIDATFSISFSGEAPSVTVNPDKSGTTVDYSRLFDDAEDRLLALSPEPVTAELIAEKPKVRTSDAELLIPAAIRALGRVPLTLVADDERWTLSRAAITDWLSPVVDGSTLRLGLDHAKASAFLTARATAIATAPKNAEFEEKDGKVVKFVPGVNGASVDIDDAIARIDQLLTATEEPTTKVLDLAIIPVLPEITTEGSNPYGIKEIIGVGGSNFAGSPRNRRHNIAVGAKAVNGTIVPSGEEFSMMKVLGAIDGSTGYLEELVIKGNKTTPEYGGGLCQIGSTAFRAALDSGMPITERRNHSYRVSYYEKDAEGKYIGPGKDATIYDPAPDFKFKNDTGHAILIRTEIVKDSLRFYFWGVRDGRTASQTDSRVSNVIPPPEKKLIETDDLKPGEEKCTEKPHPGSDAVFTYTVTYPNGETKEVDFRSHYRPWQEICLIGRDPNKPLVPAIIDPGTISADASGAAGVQ